VPDATGRPLALRVVGVVERSLPATTGEAMLIGWPDAASLGVAGADAYAIRFEPEATGADRQQLHELALRLALDDVPLDRIKGAVDEALGRIFGLFDALAAVAVVIAALGIVNTLTMNVIERVREIGVLRAAGMTRRQVWRSVVVEAGILGLAGAGLGIVLGLVVGALLVLLPGGRLDVAAGIPWQVVGLSGVLGVAVAMLSAAYPASLAARLPIVQAVKFE
jgi:putative ABC transport system permease protein